ncbi:hypothetical protein ACFY7C_09935 [Streptomyces sp. NPDC012769]|uniref:hypothetical protein n=1 Tax=Streptomyces sp. NPDC012769 TaxID=3364848 RepID=UPI00367A5A4F
MSQIENEKVRPSVQEVDLILTALHVSEAAKSELRSELPAWKEDHNRQQGSCGRRFMASQPTTSVRNIRFGG